MVINKELKMQLFINILIVLIAVFIFQKVSYAADDNPNGDNKNLTIQTGNMQVILSTPNEKYEFADLYKVATTDYNGLKQDGYNFSIKNTGNIPIEYYEIRLVDEENKISTLPHKYLRFVIKKDNEEYSKPDNLGDNDSILFSGYNLKVGDSASFNFKLWLDGSNFDISDKSLYSALEITLYQKFDIYDNYVLYDANGGIDNPTRTSIYNPVTVDIPIRDNYLFLGWSTSSTGNVDYHGGDTFKGKRGQTLYAIWKYQPSS